MGATEPTPEVEMKNPRLSFAAVDWSAARAKVAGIAELAGPGEPTATPDALTRLNAAAEKILPNIAASPVPVLLPFDPAALLRDQAQGATGDAGRYFSGFQDPIVFFPGASGYDAEFSLPPEIFGGLDLSFAKNIDVLITGSTLVYELDPPALSEQAPVPELAVGLSRLAAGPARRTPALHLHALWRSLCRVDPLLRRRDKRAPPVLPRSRQGRGAVLQSPQYRRRLAAIGPSEGGAQTVDRPARCSPEFTYYAPGDLLPGTGMKGQDGRGDPTVYAGSDIRCERRRPTSIRNRS